MIEVMEHYFAVRPDDMIFNKSDLDAMPEGTVVWHEFAAWTKNSQGLWAAPGYGANSLTPNREGFTALRSYPEGYEYVPETLTQWQWKLRDVTLAAAKRHSVSGVPETLDRLHLPDFPVGAGMRITDRSVRDNLSVLPIGSVVATGSINDPLFSLYRRAQHGWTQFYGPAGRSLGVTCTVVEVGGIEYHRAWLDEVGTQDSIDQIRVFKGKVWDEGRRAQSRHGWCGVFNQVLDVLGVNEQAAREAAAEARAHWTAGTTLTADEAGNCPVGTLFMSHHPNDDAIYWYQRISGSTRNRASTHRVLSMYRQNGRLFSGNGHFANQMTLLGYPGDWVDVGAVPLENRILQYQSVPHQTQFRFSNDPETHYVKVNNSRYRGPGGRGNIDDLLRANHYPMQVLVRENMGSSC